MAAVQPVRGTHDLLPAAFRTHRHVIDTGASVAACYGYDEMSSPIFEHTEVFARTLGDTSDVVTKEMYTFTDKGGDRITLRPEATAGICRGYLSNGLAQQAPLRVFLAGPMFRHERPQKGRLRQFHQIDIELIGAAEPAADIEVIACGAAILDALGVRARTVLELNTLGDTESRRNYRAALVEYFQDHEKDLSEDSRDRLQRNPLRILDSKDEGDRAIVADAPVFDDYLNAESREFFEAVTAGLDLLQIPYERNKRLVRGLDYYCHTAFEFTTTDLGAQGAVMAGGRYDGLIEMIGGAPTPGIGWAAGIERLSMLVDAPPPPPRPVALAPLGEAAEREAQRLAERLRRAGVRTDLAFGGNMRRRMKRADRIGARHAVLIGDDELARGVATLKDLDSGSQTEVALDRLVEVLAVKG